MPDASSFALNRTFPTNGRVRSGTFVGSANTRKVDGAIEVEASLGADSEVEMLMLIPRQLAAAPAPDLILDMLVNATTGDAKILVEWAILARPGGVPDTATLNSEGTQTLSASAAAEAFKQLVVDLDAATFAQSDAGKYLYVRLTFQTTSWTLAAISYWWAELRVTAA